ncbi:hypothetical protein Glove_280g63 [Diversispora epigaea]|uniref:Uncharacterized protein n=1 Tax=Diversispora epigaea TaxID=1348612 RepID=A0A397I634_9GLOM|nr:hypothetical protein Glove_280g63 [Diversispora epigaea]
MVEANNNTESTHQKLLQNKSLDDTSNHDPKGLQENGDKIASLIESMKKISISVNGRDTEAVCDSGSDCPIITYEKAKELGLEIDEISPRINDMIVIDLARQVLYKEIRISFRELLKIVKPEVRQDIINSIANPDITKKRKILCGGKRRCKVNKTFLNDSSSSSSTESDSASEFA